MVALFIRLLIKANYEDNEWHGQKIKRGQLITGLFSLSKSTGIPIQSIRTCLARLKSTNEITSKSTNKYRIITITKFEQYQPKEEKSTSKSTAQLTSNQQATNKQLTTIKEVKKERSKETLSAPPSATPSEPTKKTDENDPMTLKEFEDLCAKGQSHIKVIGEWAGTINPDCRTKGQWRLYIKRNLRPAREVATFTREQIENAYGRIATDKAKSKTGYLDRFTLETLLKYLTS